jgi:hypothetical protein
MKKILIGIGIIVGVLIIGVALRQEKKDERVVADSRNATYTIEGRTVKLVNGVAEEPIAGSAATERTMYFGNEARGDFDGNGTEDIAMLLVTTGGGSGTFYYIAAALQGAGGYTGTNALFLGDRIAPQTTEWRDGKIIVNYADREANQPMTQEPSRGVSRFFKVVNGSLEEVQAGS